jgi:phage shock protein A
MGFFKKLGDIARSNITALLNQLEDPKKLADQAIMDLSESKKKAKQLLVSARAAIKLAEHHKSQLIAEAQRQKKIAEQFLVKGNEKEAKLAITKKHQLTQEEEMYDQQLEKEKQVIKTINQVIASIDKKIEEIKTSAPMVELEKEDSFLTFSRMEEKIDHTEKEVEALNELLENEDKRALTDIKSFDKYSDPEAIEAELLAIRKKLDDNS